MADRCGAFFRSHADCSLSSSSGFLPNYLLPHYEEVVNRPPTPPPPYSALQAGPAPAASGPLAPEQQEGQTATPAPPVSNSLCCRPSIEEPAPPSLSIRSKPDNKPGQSAQDSGVIVMSARLRGEGPPSQEKRGESADRSGKDPLLKDLSEGCPDDKDRLPNGRRRRFTGDSGIEMCLCGTRGSGGFSGAGASDEEEKEMKELQRLLRHDGEEEGDFCDSCGLRDSFMVEEEEEEEDRAMAGLERRAPRGPSQTPQIPLQPAVCLLLQTINEQEAPQH